MGISIVRGRWEGFEKDEGGLGLISVHDKNRVSSCEQGDSRNNTCVVFCLRRAKRKNDPATRAMCIHADGNVCVCIPDS